MGIALEAPESFQNLNLVIIGTKNLLPYAFIIAGQIPEPSKQEIPEEQSTRFEDMGRLC
jgi:hypothetical protein